MADEEIGEIVLALEIAQEIDHLGLYAHVEGGGRLVEHDELRFQHHRPGDRDALALAAGKFVRIAPARRGIEADLFQCCGDALIALAVRQRLLVDLQTLADNIGDRHARAQRSVRVLKHHLHPVSERPHLAETVGVDVFPDEGDAALGRDQSRQRKAKRRLAGTGLADHAQRLAGAERQVDAVHRLDVVDHTAQEARLDGKPDFHVLGFDHDRPGGVRGRRFAPRFGGKQVAGIGVLRIGEDLGGRSGLDDLALGHDADPIGDLADDAEVVGDEQHGHAVLVLERLQKLEDLRLHRDVERRRRLVGDQELRPVGESHGYHHALALAARKLMRVGAEPLLRFANTDLLEELQRSRAGGRTLELLVDFQDFADLLLDRVQRIERCHRLLEDHGDVVAADMPELVVARLQEILPVEEDFAARMACGGVGQELQDRVGGDGFA